MSQVHELKTDAVMFDAVYYGQKTAELRVNDRDFQVGDMLVLHRIPSRPSCNEAHVTITHIAQGCYGLPNDLAMLSFKGLMKL